MALSDGESDATDFVRFFCSDCECDGFVPESLNVASPERLAVSDDSSVVVIPVVSVGGGRSVRDTLSAESVSSVAEADQCR